MKFLGIDPGYHRCGWGIIEKQGNRFTAIDYGCIETDKHDEFSTRIQQIYTEISQIIDLHQPKSIGVEELFFAKNTTTAMKVAQARGVILLSGKEKGLILAELTPNQIKQAITGQGSADKKQMQQMVKILLNLDKIPRPDDAADALAVAIATSTWTRF